MGRTGRAFQTRSDLRVLGLRLPDIGTYDWKPGISLSPGRSLGQIFLVSACICTALEVTAVAVRIPCAAICALFQ